MAEHTAHKHPRVFISYSHKSEEYKERVRNLAARLRGNGVNVILDRWHLKPGQDIYHFVENSIEKSDKVLILCEESYKKKADAMDGSGVSTEAIITKNMVLKNPDQQKFVPVIMEQPDSLPTYLEGRLFINNANDEGYDNILCVAYDIEIEEEPPVLDPPEDIWKRLQKRRTDEHAEGVKTISSELEMHNNIPEKRPGLGRTPEWVKQRIEGDQSGQNLENDTANRKPDSRASGKASDKGIPKSSAGSSFAQQDSDKSISKKKVYSGTAVVGNTITFGQYPYGKDGEKADLKWRVLDVEKDRMLIITDKLIDCEPYNKTYDRVTWETCSLRRWMNEDFIREAFNKEERSGIIQVRNNNPDNKGWKTEGGRDTTDKVFALSIDEAVKYFKNNADREAVTTPYARARGSRAYTGDMKGWWWLRLPGYIGNYAAYVLDDGGVYGRGGRVDHRAVSVRPALWLNL